MGFSHHSYLNWTAENKHFCPKQRGTQHLLHYSSNLAQSSYPGKNYRKFIPRSVEAQDSQSFYFILQICKQSKSLNLAAIFRFTDVIASVKLSRAVTSSRYQTGSALGALLIEVNISLGNDSVMK